MAPRPAPPPKLRLKLRSKLVVAMVFAALVPVILVAVLATRVILSSLEGGLRDQADRQLTVGINLVLRAVERLSDETVQLSESQELLDAIARSPHDIEKWIAGEASHIPSARLQLFDATDATVPSGDRATTTVAPQALFMLNSELVAQVSERLATSLLGETTLDGIGSVGEGAHAANESILVNRIADRAALLAMLVARLGEMDRLLTRAAQ